MDVTCRINYIIYDQRNEVVTDTQDVDSPLPNGLTIDEHLDVLIYSLVPEEFEGESVEPDWSSNYSDHTEFCLPDCSPGLMEQIKSNVKIIGCKFFFEYQICFTDVEFFTDDDIKEPGSE